VFPGGSVDSFQDGEIPPVNDPKRHEDGLPYRLAALRECFEESGILLARRCANGPLLSLDTSEREAARKAIHANKMKFTDWLASVGGVPDVGKYFHQKLNNINEAHF
jgi:8-oxo-dGTP pyrophosphatase MutT (NUDIX family)